MGYLRDPLSFEDVEDLIEVLVDVGALIERHVTVAADDALDRHAREEALHVRHLIVDALLLVLEFALRFTAGQEAPRPVVDAARTLAGPAAGSARVC